MFSKPCCKPFSICSTLSSKHRVSGTVSWKQHLIDWTNIYLLKVTHLDRDLGIQLFLKLQPKYDFV